MGAEGLREDAHTAREEGGGLADAYTRLARAAAAAAARARARTGSQRSALRRAGAPVRMGSRASTAFSMSGSPGPWW